MKEWFLTLKGEPFVAFESSHLIMLFLYGAGVFLLLYFHKEIRSNPTIFHSVRWILFTLLILSEVTYQIWTSVHGIWMFNLPFHLCGVAGLVGALALLTLNKKLMTVTFFIALLPAFLALLTPDLPYDFPNFRYFKFFIHHITISLTGVFMAVIGKQGMITFKNMLITYTLLVAYAFIVGLFINPWLDANYLFLTSPPVSSTPLDWFGNGMIYRINLGVVCFIAFTIQYFIYRSFQRKFLFNNKPNDFRI